MIGGECKISDGKASPVPTHDHHQPSSFTRVLWSSNEGVVSNMRVQITGSLQTFANKAPRSIHWTGFRVLRPVCDLLTIVMDSNVKPWQQVMFETGAAGV